MKILVWQWGRRGAGPRFGVCLANALQGRPDIETVLSLCQDAEIFPSVEACAMPVRTYAGMGGCLVRLLTAPLALMPLVWRLRKIAPALAICAMPGPLDWLMALALKLVGARVVVIAHDADTHPGDGFPGQMALQRLLCWLADAVAVLSSHVGGRLAAQGFPPDKIIAFQHPPFGFDVPAQPRPDGPPRLLCFGRLLPYKGLDLLAEALAPVTGIETRVAGRGPESAALDALRALPRVTVDNRWLAETEIGPLLTWADAVILPYREASQSGVAAAALAAGRTVIATRVGGLAEQLAATPNAILCDPDAASLRAAIRQWQSAPAPAALSADPDAAWRRAATGLLSSIAARLDARSTAVAGGVLAVEDCQ